MLQQYRAEWNVRLFSRRIIKLTFTVVLLNVADLFKMCKVHLNNMVYET